MTAPRLRLLLAPAYLLACLLLGGSIQGVGFVLFLQLSGIALLAWALIDRSRWSWRPQAQALPLIAALLAAITLIQLVPLPPPVWTAIPGRAEIADGYRLLGQPVPWRPISLAPDDTIAVLLTFIPPLAMVALIVKAKASSGVALTLALAAATLVSIGLGFAQVSSGGRFYLYPWVAMGTPAGLFANPNHAAALLLAAFPFVIGFAVTRWTSAKRKEDRFFIVALASLYLAVLALAIAINGSLAVALLGLPVAAASAFLALPAGRVRLGRIGLVLGALLLAGVALWSTGSQFGVGQSSRVSLESRQEIWSKTGEAVGDHWLAGSGLGTFADVYRLYEDPSRVGNVYVNHAHNDYLELAVELGIAGMLLIALFLAWWT